MNIEAELKAMRADMAKMTKQQHETDLRLAATEQELSTLIMLFQEEDELEQVVLS